MTRQLTNEQIREMRRELLGKEVPKLDPDLRDKIEVVLQHAIHTEYLLGKERGKVRDLERRIEELAAI